VNEVENGLRPGDVVVISPEYDALWGPVANVSALWELIEQRPQDWAYLGRAEQTRLLKDSFAEPQDYAHRLVLQSYYRVYSEVFSHTPARVVYSRSGFDRFGDFATATGLASAYRGAPACWVTSFPGAYLAKRIALLNCFVARCRDHGVRVFFSYPPLAQDYYVQNKALIEATAAALSKGLQAPIIDTPAQMVFPPGDFYDMQNHLRGAAVDIRTERLLASLRSELRKPTQ